MAEPPHDAAAGAHRRRAPSRAAAPRRGHDAGLDASGRGEVTHRLTASDVLTASEVAELLHVPDSTVGDWARRQVIPSLKLGRRRIFIRSKIEALLLADEQRTDESRP